MKIKLICYEGIKGLHKCMIICIKDDKQIMHSDNYNNVQVILYNDINTTEITPPNKTKNVTKKKNQLLY